MYTKIYEAKKALRKNIATEKAKYSADQLIEKSKAVIEALESTKEFKEAIIILAYNSMEDEVYTKDLLERWKDTKSIYLPVILDDKMVFRLYKSDTRLVLSPFGIEEPKGEDLKDFSSIDLIIVPGVAFDKQLNRMGRGKGYYDSFLQNIPALKFAISFDFQLVEEVPVTKLDVKMDKLIGESELLG